MQIQNILRVGFESNSFVEIIQDKEAIKNKENQDNHITDYIFVSYDQFDEVDLLPLEIRDIFKE